MLQHRTKPINRFSYSILTHFIPSNNDYCGRNESFPNQVLFALGWAVLTLAPTRTSLFNLTLGRDSSHPCLIEGCTVHTLWYTPSHPCFIEGCTVHTIWYTPSLGQVLIRQGWEESLPDVGLSKFVQVGVRVDLPIPKRMILDWGKICSSHNYYDRK